MRQDSKSGTRIWDKCDERRLYTLNGGDDGIRTHDLCVANAALSQLSYIPMMLWMFIKNRLRRQGLAGCEIQYFCK